MRLTKMVEVPRSPAELQLEFSDMWMPEPNSGCWLWLRAFNRETGYGMVRAGKKVMLAHRLSFIIYKGEISDGLLLLHSCDNPCCVNPDHLSPGTYADNTDDMMRKGRGGWPTKIPRSEHQWIRDHYANDTMSQTAMARHFGVSRARIYQITLGA